jgi:hypothetical protein
MIFFSPPPPPVLQVVSLSVSLVVNLHLRTSFLRK